MIPLILLNYWSIQQKRLNSTADLKREKRQRLCPNCYFTKFLVTAHSHSHLGSLAVQCHITVAKINSLLSKWKDLSPASSSLLLSLVQHFLKMLFFFFKSIYSDAHPPRNICWPMGKESQTINQIWKVNWLIGKFSTASEKLALEVCVYAI